MHKWTKDVATILNANLYTQLDISKACYLNSKDKYMETLLSSKWNKEVAQIRENFVKSREPK
jgi:hypothetical protein